MANRQFPRKYEQYFTDYNILEQESYQNPAVYITLEIVAIAKKKKQRKYDLPYYPCNNLLCFVINEDSVCCGL